MTIKTIIGEHGAMPLLCRNGACPAAVLTVEGDVFVQGYLPATAEAAQLTAPSGEGFVRMSRTTFEAIARQVLTS